MRLKFNIATLLVFFFFAGNLNATNPISPEAYAEIAFSVDDFMNMDYKAYKTLTGKKWVLGDRLKHKALKKYLEFQLNRNAIDSSEEFAPAAGAFNFKWGAFFLGFFLNILGLLIVVLIYDKPRKNAVLSWLIGFLIGGAGIGIFLR